MDCSLLVSSVHGILQAKILEWVAISFYKSVSRSVVSDSLQLHQSHWREKGGSDSEMFSFSIKSEAEMEVLLVQGGRNERILLKEIK